MTRREPPAPAGYITYRQGRALFVLRDPASFTDARVQVAVALRNQATIAGACPACGARGLNRAARRRLAHDRSGELVTQTIEHERECPAGDDRLRELLAATGEAA